MCTPVIRTVLTTWKYWKGMGKSIELSILPIAPRIATISSLRAGGGGGGGGGEGGGEEFIQERHKRELVAFGNRAQSWGMFAA